MLKIWAADTSLVKRDVLASFGALENSFTLDHCYEDPSQISRISAMHEQ
jgi:hypothetical protein